MLDRVVAVMNGLMYDARANIAARASASFLNLLRADSTADAGLTFKALAPVHATRA